ncbi:hypothetical protein AB1Y20_017032 [Prymnesium parvum]|uniref:CHAT domain-containing protein n=1 Tax=Prymnesium parvum TaxID=97485 RepID=A0AB34I9R6_PRYPA
MRCARTLRESGLHDPPASRPTTPPSPWFLRRSSSSASSHSPAPRLSVPLRDLRGRLELRRIKLTGVRPLAVAAELSNSLNRRWSAPNPSPTRRPSVVLLRRCSAASPWRHRTQKLVHKEPSLSARNTTVSESAADAEEYSDTSLGAYPRNVKRLLRECSCRRRKQRQRRESEPGRISFNAITHSLNAPIPASPSRHCSITSDHSSLEFSNSTDRSIHRGHSLQSTLASYITPEESDHDLLSKDAMPEVFSMEMNRKIRKELFQQSFYTNRFHGSPSAIHAEASFHAFVTKHQLPIVARRLSRLSLVYVAVTLADAVNNSRSAWFVVVKVVIPASLLSLTALACNLRQTKRWWRLYVMMSAVGSYGSIAASDWVLHEEFVYWSSYRKDNNSMWQLIWFLLCACLSSLFLALDMVLSWVLLLLLWLCYAVNGAALWLVWFHESNQPSFSFSDVIEGWPSVNLSENATHTDGGRGVSFRGHLDCLLASILTVVMLLGSIRRMNRTDRLSFVNQHVLHMLWSKQQGQLEGREVELLALFSNPCVTSDLRSSIQAGLRPLHLGQELKFLLRAVPKQFVSVEPAAALSDAAQAVKEHNPRILLFSGHSFMGTLAFELPDGRIDLPQPSQFIHLLQADVAPRLQCVFLNGCCTAELGYQIVQEIPELMVICWSTITEDASARVFAQGFYDAVGAFIADGDSVQLELAFWAGLERFRKEDYRLGDPEAFLHPPGHPHLRHLPQPNCDGCHPPVHGCVVLFKNHRGQVHRLRMGTKDRLAHEDPAVSPRTAWLPASLDEIADGSFLAHLHLHANPPGEPDSPFFGGGRRLSVSAPTRVVAYPHRGDDSPIGAMCTARPVAAESSSTSIFCGADSDYEAAVSDMELSEERGV